LGHKQTSGDAQVMSALPLKADISERYRHARFVPKADIGTHTGSPHPGLTVTNGVAPRVQDDTSAGLNARGRELAIMTALQCGIRHGDTRSRPRASVRMFQHNL
jgi:hypothetical protein